MLEPNVRHHRRICQLACLAAALTAYQGATAQSADTAVAPAAVSQTYSVINLGDGQVFGPRINNKGQVSFSSRRWYAYQGKFFDGRVIHDTGDLGFIWSYAVDLNDAGQVAGYSNYQPIGLNDFFHATLWTQATGIADLGALPGDLVSRTTAINSKGQIVGASQSTPGPGAARTHAFRWTPGSGMLDLGALYQVSSAFAINDAGQVAGVTGPDNGPAVAFVWTPQRGMVALGTLGGAESFAVGINGPGQIAGYSNVANGDRHAFWWTPHRRMLDLGTLGGNNSFATGINDAGQVSGSSTRANGNQHAFLWTQSGGMRDLGTLGGATSAASDINRYGHIVGRSAVRSGADHAFLWSTSSGMIDLNRRIALAPPGLVLIEALGLADNGSLIAMSNAGLVRLAPTVAGPAAPVAGPILTPSAPVHPNEPLSVSVRFVDANPADTHRATISWGANADRKLEPATVVEKNGAGQASATHTFSQPGDYIVVITVTDSSGLSAPVTRTITVCDPAEPSCQSTPASPASNGPAGGS